MAARGNLNFAEETTMSKMLLVLGMAAAVTVTGVRMWKAAEATPLTGATGSLAAIKSPQQSKRLGAYLARNDVPQAPSGLVSSIQAQPGKHVSAALASVAR